MRFYVYGWFVPGGECFYIGKGTGDRWRNRASSRRNDYFNNIVKRHPDAYPIIIYDGLYNLEAIELEIELISKFTPRANFTLGGEGVIGYQRSPAEIETHRVKLREKWKDPIFRQRMSAAHMGHKHSEEHRQKIGLAHFGLKRPAGTGEKIAATKRGKPRSEETKEKIRTTLLNKKSSVKTIGNF